LQTYQRESKPIQDVYGQVTHLFKTAPDLLEDFKQFLPESAAQARAAERAAAEAQVMTSTMRSTIDGNPVYGSPIISREPHMATPAHRGGLPPVGNFAPTPASKDNKRKRTDRQGTAGLPDSVPGPSAAAKAPPYPGPPGKRMKQNHVVAKPEQPPSSPTLIPHLPAPLEPTTTSAANSDEIAFFDKAKKAISNKGVFNEFLKLCNLFSQDLIDRGTLLWRAKSFIGQNPELLKWFQDWLGHDERDIIVDNAPRIPTGRVMLSNCRGLGPSYRLLPKRERQKPCSGRDELCNSVLNDEWASHPTWASEDSGFIAHRKNVFEEGLHRIEEERHDYDFNIEAASRTVQLLEPIATQLRRMDEGQQRSYVLPNGLGGQSETIYKRVIMKLYGRDKGGEVIQSLHERPFQVIPVLLNRIKERLESWRMAQREWEKVWREQTQKMFWRSLDHQAAQPKGIVDRRAFQSKTLQSEVQVRYEEMKRASLVNPALGRMPQLEYTIDDPSVLVDTTHLVLTHVRAALETDHPRLVPFLEDFVPLFFGLDADNFKAQLQVRAGELTDDTLSGGEDTPSISSRKGNGKNNSLLRTALDPVRGRKSTRREREDSQASGSRASTPDVTSNADPEDMAVDTTEESESKDVGTGRWLEHPIDGNSLNGKDINPHEPHRRDLYRCWSNSTLYCFIRLFVMLYERLYKLKTAESEVAEAVRTARIPKPAQELGIIDKTPSDFFDLSEEKPNYYSQMLQKFEDCLNGVIEFAEVEEPLRRYYLQSGYPLYLFEKMVQTLSKDAAQVINSDSKEKSAEIVALFKKDRIKECSTAQQQTDYRKAAEKMVKDAELYRIDYVSLTRICKDSILPHLLTENQDQMASKVKIYLHKRDDPIADDGLTEMDRENRWRFYIASYTSIDPTDGVDQNAIQAPFLMSNMRRFGTDPRAGNLSPANSEEAHRAALADKTRALDVKNEERLEIRIAVNNYRAFFQAHSFESWHANLADRERGKAGVENAEDIVAHREDVVTENYEMNNAAMKEMSKEAVERKNAAFAELVDTAPASINGGADESIGDVEMDG
jgi:paired amphipathic helix protein Sin3a